MTFHGNSSAQKSSNILGLWLPPSGGTWNEVQWLPRYFVLSTQGQTDKFETLCYVEADLSTALYESKLSATGKTYYQWIYEVILLVGLTELKAQVSWIDSETVRVHILPHPIYIYLTKPPSMFVNLGDGEKVCDTIL